MIKCHPLHLGLPVTIHIDRWQWWIPYLKPICSFVDKIFKHLAVCRQLITCLNICTLNCLPNEGGALCAAWEVSRHMFYGVTLLVQGSVALKCDQVHEYLTCIFNFVRNRRSVILILLWPFYPNYVLSEMYCGHQKYTE